MCGSWGEGEVRGLEFGGDLWRKKRKQALKCINPGNKNCKYLMLGWILDIT